MTSVVGYRGELTINGTLHLRARDYNAHTGTFTKRDPMGGVPGTTVQTDPYHYAANDPLSRVDPLGLRPGPSTDSDAAWKKKTEDGQPCGGNGVMKDKQCEPAPGAASASDPCDLWFEEHPLDELVQSVNGCMAKGQATKVGVLGTWNGAEVRDYKDGRAFLDDYYEVRDREKPAFDNAYGSIDKQGNIDYWALADVSTYALAAGVCIFGPPGPGCVAATLVHFGTELGHLHAKGDFTWGKASVLAVEAFAEMLPGAMTEEFIAENVATGLTVRQILLAKSVAEAPAFAVFCGSQIELSK